MMKLAILIWIMLGTTIAGSAVTVVLVTPILAANAMLWIPVAGILGYVVAVPLSIMVAKRITDTTKHA